MLTLETLNHPKLQAWIRTLAALLEPAKVHLCDGSQQEYDGLMEAMCQAGQAIRLNPQKRPNSFLFRSDPRDVARVESRTFICTPKASDAGPTNHWAEPKQMKEDLHAAFRGSMRGRTLYIVPFCMGPLGSELASIGVQLTDSPYVVCNMRIMTRMGHKVLEALGSDGRYVACLHSVGQPLEPGQKDVAWPCNPEKTCIAHFPQKRLIYSYGSGYGGNALLGKKCFALRIASYIAREEDWLAEHMLLLGMQDPQGRKAYIAAAFPSACGKTNLAMLQAPESLPGWTLTTVGDDIAWLRPHPDGSLRAINPEAGFFGVAPGTSLKTNPNALASCARNSIFTNVALTPDGDVWWEGMTDPPPEGLIDWLGQPWTPDADHPAAHPNSRFTAPLEQCPCVDPHWDNPEGVPISAILFGGRRMRDMPLIVQSFSWSHGVYLGATMASEQTAAAEGTVGRLRNDPMGMLPFCGYHIGDYFLHWLSMGRLLAHKPAIFHVNWFRKDAQGHYLWPGFSENLRVLEWILKRIHGNAKALETPLGWIPHYEDMNWTALPYPQKTWDALMHVTPEALRQQLLQHHEAFLPLSDHLPSALAAEHTLLGLRIE